MALLVVEECVVSVVMFTLIGLLVTTILGPGSDTLNGGFGLFVSMVVSQSVAGLAASTRLGLLKRRFVRRCSLLVTRNRATIVGIVPFPAHIGGECG